jgi:hypothetical protein
MPQADTQDVAAPETPPADATPPVPEPSLSDAIKASLEETPPADEPTEEAAPEGETPPAETPPEAEPPPVAEPPKAEEPPVKKDLLEELGPLPENASNKTKERFERLTTGYKEVTAERDTLRTELEQAQYIADGWAQAVQKTGADVQQVATMFQYLEARNSPTPAGRRQAYETLKSELVALAKELGEEAPGVDPLEGHDDLREAVAIGSIEQSHAMELARARAAQKFQQQQFQQHQQSTHAEAIASSAVNSIRQYAGQKQRENEAEYQAKRGAVETYAQRIMADTTVTPNQWPGLIAAYYESIPMPAAAAAPPAPPRVPNPIRATGVGAGKSTGLAQEPKNTAEAIALAMRQSQRA